MTSIKDKPGGRPVKKQIEKQEAQVTPASREETLERLDAIEQALPEQYGNLAVPGRENF